MSTKHDDIEWVLGETWSLIVTCHDEAGNDVTPTAADWKLKTLDGTTVRALTDGNGITLNGNTATVTVESVSQTGIGSATYRDRLYITDSGNAVSRQAHGIIKVLPDE